MLRALDIITAAYKRMNRLSPGEALSSDDAAYSFDVLNELVDELSAQNLFLFQSVLTSAAQSGAITLGTGAWAAISPGDQIVSATCNNVAMAEITMQQYNELYQPTVTGSPTCWASDGLNTVYLWPVPNGQTIKLQTRTSVSGFADQTTQYNAPDGWRAALSAALAVRLAPAILGNVPAALMRAEKACMGAVNRYEPAIMDFDTFNNSRRAYALRLV